MTTIKEQKKQDDLSLAFHNWRHEDVISKLFFNHVAYRIEEATRALKHLYTTDFNKEEKLIKLGALSASIEMLEGLLALTYDECESWIQNYEAK